MSLSLDFNSGAKSSEMKACGPMPNRGVTVHKIHGLVCTSVLGLVCFLYRKSKIKYKVT